MDTAEFSLKTPTRCTLIPITRNIAEQVRQQGWQNGILTVFIPHTTAGITINENADPDVVRDMSWFMDRLIPNQDEFKHAEGNSDAHIKASLFGASVQVIVRSGQLWLGTWQGIYFCECDGPRSRTVQLAFLTG